MALGELAKGVMECHGTAHDQYAFNPRQETLMRKVLEPSVIFFATAHGTVLSGIYPIGLEASLGNDSLTDHMSAGGAHLRPDQFFERFLVKASHRLTQGNGRRFIARQCRHQTNLLRETRNTQGPKIIKEVATGLHRPL